MTSDNLGIKHDFKLTTSRAPLYRSAILSFTQAQGLLEETALEEKRAEAGENNRRLEKISERKGPEFACSTNYDYTHDQSCQMYWECSMHENVVECIENVIWINLQVALHT